MVHDEFGVYGVNRAAARVHRKACRQPRKVRPRRRGERQRVDPATCVPHCRGGAIDAYSQLPEFAARVECGDACGRWQPVWR